MSKRIKNYIKKIIKLVKLDEMEILPGHLAFYLIFILIPIISFIGIIVNNINIPTDNYELISKNIPNSVISLINNSNINYNNFNIIVFTFINLWLASRGTYAIIISSNLIYKVKEKDNLKVNLKSITITAMLFILIAFIIIVPILGDLIVSIITNYFNKYLIINTIYHIIKYPISIILIFLLLKIIYTISPSKKINSKYMNHGAMFTTIMWISLSRIYSFYLNNFNHYNIYYGNLSNILILLIWVYLLSYIFVIGMALNATNYFENNKEK